MYLCVLELQIESDNPSYVARIFLLFQELL